MRIVLLMGEVIKLFDALVQILCSFSVATFQYGLEKVQTTNKMILDNTKGILRPWKNIGTDVPRVLVAKAIVVC